MAEDNACLPENVPIISTLTYKSQPHGKMHKEMTEINYYCYGLLLLPKCGHFHTQHNISLFFSLTMQTFKHLVQNPALHNII